MRRRHAALLLVLLTLDRAEAREYDVTKIADETDLPGAFGGFLLYPSINGGGEVAFYAASAIHVGSGGPVVTRAVTTAVDPSSHFVSLEATHMNDEGTIAFYAVVNELVLPDVGAEAVFALARGGGLTVIAGQRQRDPTQPFEGNFSRIPDINRGGTVAFTGAMPNSPQWGAATSPCTPRSTRAPPCWSCCAAVARSPCP